MEIAETFDTVGSRLDHWATIATSLLPNFVLAVLVLILFFPLARWVRRFARKQSMRVSDSQALQGLIAQAAFTVVLLIGVVISLNVLHLDKTVASLLAGAGIIGLALGFAFQDITANFIAGVIMAIRKPIAVGDVVKTNGYMGTVDHLDLRTTTILNFEGQRIIIPNKQVFQEPLVNFSGTDHRRVDVEVGISYGDDLRKALQVAVDTVKGIDGVLLDEAVEAHYVGFGDSSINMSIRFWIRFPGSPGLMDVRTEAFIRIKEAFDKADISIPFPIRTLDLGIKGGVSMADEPILVKMNGEAESN